MTVEFHEVLKASLFPFFLLTLAIWVLLKAIPERAHAQATGFVCFLILAFWVQAYFFNWEYGVLDGSTIDWESFTYHKWLDVVVLGFLSLFLLNKKLRDALGNAALVIVLVQTVSIAVQYSTSARELANVKNHSSNESLEAMYEFSRTQNIIHIVMDGFQSDVFNELVFSEQDPLNFRDALNGFTFYSEALGVYPFTRFSVPAYLSEAIFRNQSMKKEFIVSTMQSDNLLFNLASKHGYEIDIADPGGLLSNSFTHAHTNNHYDYSNLNPLKKEISESIQLWDISLFRIVPHLLKRYVYNDQKMAISSIAKSSNKLNQFFFQSEFLLELIIENAAITRDKPVYKYIHLFQAHNPMVTNPDCTFSRRLEEMSRQSLTVQSRCGLRTLTRVFSKLKELNLYDSSLILLHSDHGGSVSNYRNEANLIVRNKTHAAPDWLVSLASPLLLIKPPLETGEIRIDPTYVSLLQIPSTINSLFGLSGDYKYPSLLAPKIRQLITRPFFYYEFGSRKIDREDGHLSFINEFAITRSHYETDWQLIKTYLPPKTEKGD